MSSRRAFVFACLLLLLGAGMGQGQPPHVVGFMTDFDVKDDAVGLSKAVMEGVAPGARVIDLTHQIRPFDMAQGARVLAGAVPYFAHDAIFVVVIDPGVGSARKAIIAKSKVGQCFVLLDRCWMARATAFLL